MIALLKGIILEKQAPTLVLDVNGVGYELEAPLSAFYDLPAIGESTLVYVHMVVREDAQLLFGFADRQQRELFRSLIKVNGVGPKVALAVLSTLSAAELLQAMSSEDVTQLCKVPGIGKKTALRLVVEMKDRLEKEFGELAFEASGSSAGRSDARQDAIAALLALGYKSADAKRVVNNIDPELPSEEQIRQALRVLSGNVL